MVDCGPFKCGVVQVGRKGDVLLRNVVGQEQRCCTVCAPLYMSQVVVIVTQAVNQVWIGVL
jgi:hypothetical protein